MVTEDNLLKFENVNLVVNPGEENVGIFPKEIVVKNPKNEILYTLLICKDGTLYHSFIDNKGIKHCQTFDSKRKLKQEQIIYTDKQGICYNECYDRNKKLMWSHRIYMDCNNQQHCLIIDKDENLVGHTISYEDEKGAKILKQLNLDGQMISRDYQLGKMRSSITFENGKWKTAHVSFDDKVVSFVNKRKIVKDVKIPLGLKSKKNKNTSIKEILISNERKKLNAELHKIISNSFLSDSEKKISMRTQVAKYRLMSKVTSPNPLVGTLLKGYFSREK